MLGVQYKFTFTFFVDPDVCTLYLFSLTLYSLVWILSFTVRRHRVIRPEFMLHVNLYSLNEQCYD